jgi:AcrR family transcriptional regulator
VSCLTLGLSKVPVNNFARLHKSALLVSSDVVTWPLDRSLPPAGCPPPASLKDSTYMPRVSAEDRRAEFVAAAARAIAQHGVAGATTRVIASEAGAPQATLHYCFRSKEELLLQLVDHATESTVKISEVEPGLGLGATAAALVHKYAEWLVQEPDLALATHDLYLWALPRRRDLADGAAQRNRELTRATLREGLVPSDDPALVDEVARMTQAVSDGIALQWFLHHDEEMLRIDVDNGAHAVAAIATRRADATTGGR